MDIPLVLLTFTNKIMLYFEKEQEKVDNLMWIDVSSLFFSQQKGILHLKQLKSTPPNPSFQIKDEETFL